MQIGFGKHSDIFYDDCNLAIRPNKYAVVTHYCGKQFYDIIIA